MIELAKGHLMRISALLFALALSVPALAQSLHGTVEGRDDYAGGKSFR